MITQQIYRIKTALVVMLFIASLSLRADEVQEQDKTLTQKLYATYDSLKLVRDISMYSFFAAWTGYVLNKPHQQRNLIDYVGVGILPAILNYNRDPLTAAILAGGYSYARLHKGFSAALTDGAIISTLTLGTVSLLWIYMFLDVLIESRKLIPFRQRMIVVNETGEPLTLWADTPCDSGDEVWRVPYTVTASSAAQEVDLAAWHWATPKKNKLQQEIACFSRWIFPTKAARWWPFPFVDYIRFMIIEEGTKKAQYDSCLLPIHVASVFGTYPVYIVRKNGNNLEVYLKPLEYQSLKTRWLDDASNISFPYINQIVPYVFSKALRALVDSTLTEQRIDPVRSCKV
jgi:hypothetical protein